MYNISSDVLELFKKNYRQIASITVRGTNRTFELTESDILQGGLSIDRYCVSGSKIEIGSAVAGELTLKLDNRNDRFADDVFEGAELEIKIGIKKWDAYAWENAIVHWIPCGFFTVDEPPRKLDEISLTALDRMARFDTVVSASEITVPISIGDLLLRCCTDCSVPLETVPATLLNYNYSVTSLPDDEELTYRQLIQWIAEITGTCAYIDWNGKLRLAWYGDTDTNITKAERYSSDIHESDIEITGVQISDDENIYLAGTDDYAFNIEGNLLISHDQADLAASLYNALGGFTYRPYTCTCKPMAHIYPLDKITYTDKEGVAHSSIVTNTTFKMNATLTLAGKGETATKNGYASANPLTKAESIVLRKMKKEIHSTINQRTQALIDLNSLISSSMGLFKTAMTQDNGSEIVYFHDGDTLPNSSVIYTYGSNGFAWTDEWAGDETVWNYGFTRDGNAVLNILSTYKIISDYIDAGAVTTDKLSVEYRQSVTDAIDSSTTTLTQLFQAADGVLRSQITEKASQTDLNALDGRVGTAETSIQQNAAAILLRATKTSVDDLTGRVNTAEAIIETQAGQILAKASQTDLNALDGRVGTAESTILAQGNKIALLVESGEDGDTISAASIVAAINESGSTIQISADHIDIAGAVTIGGLATTSDIPQYTSELTNNSGYTTTSAINSSLNTPSSTMYQRVVSIVDGTVTANFIDTKGLVVKDTSNNILLSARGNQVKIAGFNVSGTSLDNLDSDGYGMFISGASFGVNSKVLMNGYIDDYGYPVLNPGETTPDYANLGVQFDKAVGLMNITSTPIPGNDYYTYIPLMMFVSGYEDPFQDGNVIPVYKYICVRKWNTNSTWNFIITSSLNFSNGAGSGAVTL